MPSSLEERLQQAEALLREAQTRVRAYSKYHTDLDWLYRGIQDYFDGKQ